MPEKKKSFWEYLEGAFNFNYMPELKNKLAAILSDGTKCYLVPEFRSVEGED